MIDAVMERQRMALHVLSGYVQEGLRRPGDGLRRSALLLALGGILLLYINLYISLLRVVISCFLHFI
jgi:hypothetical protein